MPIQAIIADDEKELRRYLRSLLAETWKELEICAEAADGEEVLKQVETFAPAVVFLDIRMPGLSGLDAAQKIAGCCRIVFVTAYEQYAVEAFEREALDYLVKPVSRERLAITVDRLKKQLSMEDCPAPANPEAVRRILADIRNLVQPEYLHWMRVQHNGAVRLIPVEDVAYIQAEDKYTVVMTAAGEFLINKSIKELCRMLDPAKFWQIHRSTIVNVSRIEGVSRSLTGRGVMKLINRKEILTVSRPYLHLFKQM